MLQLLCAQLLAIERFGPLDLVAVGLRVHWQWVCVYPLQQQQFEFFVFAVAADIFTAITAAAVTAIIIAAVRFIDGGRCRLGRAVWFRGPQIGQFLQRLRFQRNWFGLYRWLFQIRPLGNGFWD